MMRRGASILAAAAVVAGGLTVGAGTASAVCIASGGLAQIESIAQPVCQNARNQWVSESVADVEVDHSVPISAAPGDEVHFALSITNSGDPARRITKVVHHAPAGFVLKSVTSYKYRFVPAENRSYIDPVDLTSEFDPATGALTLTAPPGQSVDFVDKITVSATYEVGEFLTGISGVTFEATGVPQTQNWLAKGWTARQNLLGGLGSTGS